MFHQAASQKAAGLKRHEAMWIYALYVFAPVTDGKKFEHAFPGLCGKIHSATAGAESRPPRSEKNCGDTRPANARIFSPSVVGSGSVVFCTPYRSKSVFAYVIGYGRGKSSFLAHVLGYGRGKNSRHPAAAPQKRNCAFSQLRTGKAFVFCTHYRLRMGKTTRSVGIFLALAFAGPR